MKKLLPLLLLINVFGALHAQKSDPKATEILKAVGAKYKAYQTVKADFKVTTENKDGKVNDTHTGTLYLKGQKYKIELQNQDIITDNKTVWTFLKDAKEVQINNYEADENTINPSQIFTLYEKNFLYALMDEKVVNGKTIQTIDLTPNDKSRNYFKVRLLIDKADKSIIRSEVFNKDGTRVNYEMEKLTPNIPLADTFFSFDPKQHPGVDVEDLR